MGVIYKKTTKYLMCVSFLSVSILLGNSTAFGEENILPPKGSIDTPPSGSILKGDSEITGWFMDGNGVSQVEILIDGKSMGLAEYGISRPDVLSAYPDYQNSNSGYHFSLKTNTLSDGRHTLTVRETGQNNSSASMNSLINVQNTVLAPKGYIESPISGAKISGTTNIVGWFLDESGVSNIDILIDGKKVGSAEYGAARPDVEKAFPDYHQGHAGFQYSLDSRSLTNGKHTFTVRETGKDGKTTDLTNQTVDVQNISAKGYLETPMSGSTISREYAIQGWFLDESGVSKVEILVDGKNVGVAEYGLSRPDVAKVYPAFQNTNSGYQYQLDTRGLENGQHTIVVRETGNNGNTTLLDSSMVNVQNVLSKGYIETPTLGSFISGASSVQGWFLDQSGVSKVEIFIDGKSAGIAEYGISRSDVAKVFPEFQNANSGYKYNFDTRNLVNGQHTLSVKGTGSNGRITDLGSLKVNVNNEVPRGSIDLPSGGTTISGTSNVQGWFLDQSGVLKVEIFVDGKYTGLAEYGISRPDVAKAYPVFNNKNSGFKLAIDTRKLTNGLHTVVAKGTGNNGMSTEFGSQKINVQNLPTKGSIDSPAFGVTNKGEVTVSGWLLDVSGVSKVEVLVDGINLGTAQYGISRPDVAQAFPDYQNTNSGYQFTFDSLRFTDGQHELFLKETGENGATYITKTSIFIYNGNPYLQIDLRKPSNITAADIVNFFNQKRPDSPLKNYAQSFIDAQNKFGVNAQYLVAHAIWETGWGGSALRTYKHNLFGYGAYDPCPFTCGYYFPDGSNSIYYEAYIVRRDYLSETGSYYNGPNLTGMNIKYATDPNWKNGIANLMQSIKSFDALSYFQSGILPGSSVPADSFGRSIPTGQPYPANIIINYTTDTYATVINGPWSLRSIPYVSDSALLKYVNAGTVVKVLGYNTDIKENGAYPYDKRWYRVSVNGFEGWLYGGGLSFN